MVTAPSLGPLTTAGASRDAHHTGVINSPVVDSPDPGQPQWLGAGQQRSWRALVMGTTLLFDRLDDDLRHAHDISLVEYEILVRLSERDGQMRMAALADALAHSRSRVTHTVTRMEKAGLVQRSSSPDAGPATLATLPTKAHTLSGRRPRPTVAGDAAPPDRPPA